jgi:rod shape determining protein RodA
MWNRFKTLDPWLYVIPAVLLTISVVVIYALTVESQGTSLFYRHLFFSVAALVVMLLTTFVDYRSLRGWAGWIYLAGLAGLALVEFIGTVEFGAQSWIELGFFRLQPGELSKLILVIVLAALLATRKKISGGRFILAILLLLIPAAVILQQPDFGTALVAGIAGVAVLLYAPLLRWQRIVVIAGVIFLASGVALSFRGVAPFDHLLKDYQKDRLASFIDPSRDKSRSGYNVVQSVIAVGSGGLTGKGLGFGSQSQLNFLPVAHADFIFAVIAEAWGLVGAWGVIVLLGMLASRVILAAHVAKDTFGALVCVGIAAKLLTEILVNIGMNIQVMPVTGIPLPFLSYGGTTMLTNALAIGLVQSIVIRYKRLTF